MRAPTIRSAPLIVAGLLVIGCAANSVPAPDAVTSPSAPGTAAPSAMTPTATPTLFPTQVPSASPSPSSPTEPSWSATGSMVEGRRVHTATLLEDGRVLVVGGFDAEGPPIADGAHIRLASAELYDPRTGQWTATGSLRTARATHTATLLLDGTVLVVGGGDESNFFEGGPRSPTAELYDPRSGTWTSTGTMTEARRFHSATLLLDGSVLVAGGGVNYVESEIYDPASGTWTATGSMSEGRRAHSATLMLDGRVLVAGGCACSEPPPTASAELYDPTTGTWTPTHPMHVGRMAHTAVLLADGGVLVVGDGIFHDKPVPPERYDPATGRWTAIERMLQERIGPTVTRLADGTVLVAGGYDPDRVLGVDPTPLATAESYDPGTGRWTASAAMSTARSSNLAILLADGTVLVAGGAIDDAPDDATSAEIYDPGDP